MAIPKPTQRALKIHAPGDVRVTESCAIPTIRPDEALVRVVCVTVNPVDWKSADLSATIGATVGCDLSGEVVLLGEKALQRLEVGDRVFGCMFGNNPLKPDNGAFAEYAAIHAGLLAMMPQQMSFEVAATLGLGLCTVGMALYHNMKLPLPRQPEVEPRFVLVYGGGTATGRLAIQMFRLSGLQPVTTCSPRNFESVKALGAVEAFDYHSETCGTDIRSFMKDTLGFALDCITSTESMRICYSAIGPKGGKYVALDPFPIRSHSRRNVRPSWVSVFTVFNKPTGWQRQFRSDAKPENHEFAIKWYRQVESLLEDGLIEPGPFEERSGGLSGIVDGIRLLRQGEAKKGKMVYRVSDVDDIKSN